MAYEIRENPYGWFVLVAPNGTFARDTNGLIFVTENRTRAEEAAAYVNQPVPPMGKRVGAHWLKSTFGVF